MESPAEALDDRIDFDVQGSGDWPYRVTFVRNGGQVMASCQCNAGLNGQICKHRIRIMEGLEEAIVSGNANRVQDISDWIRGTALGAALTEMRASEEAVETAKKYLTATRKKLAVVMRGGD